MKLSKTKRVANIVFKLTVSTLTVVLPILSVYCLLAFPQIASKFLIGGLLLIFIATIIYSIYASMGNIFKDDDNSGGETDGKQ